MFTASSEKRRPDGGSGSRVKKRSPPPELMLPPLCPPPLPVASASSHPPTITPLSVTQLPRLIAQVGPSRAIGDTKWTDGRRLFAAALGTDLPLRPTDESTATSPTEKESIKACTHQKTKTTTLKNRNKPDEVALSGTEVAHLFSTRRNLEVFRLEPVDDGASYRPYDLRVVRSSSAGPDHFIFTPHAVLQVTQKGCGELISLADWCRESRIWSSLQEIPFFRDFRLRKAFVRWKKNVRRIVFQRRCEELEEQLLIIVPQFRKALFMFTETTEEVKRSRRLPQESRSFTLLEFSSVLTTIDQERLNVLEKLSRHRDAVLNMVREDSYRSHQELQLLLKNAKKLNKSSEPIHLQLSRQREVKKDLARSEGVLHKLGRFASLVNHMTIQSLVTLVRRDVASFLDAVEKRNESQSCLFIAELCFSADNQLIIDPPINQFYESVREALLTAGDSVIQMCDSAGLFLEVRSSSDAPQSSSCSAPPADLTVHAHRVHGCYCPLRKEQLQWHICLDDITAQTEDQQVPKEVQHEVQQLCQNFSWMKDVRWFISSSRASLGSMKGRPASLYEEQLKEVHLQTTRIQTVPLSISTSNQLVIIQCSHLKECLGEQLKLLEEEVLQQLVDQIQLQSESLVSDLERAAAGLQTDPRDLHQLSTFALKTRQSVKMLAETQSRLQYVQSLQQVCMKHRVMTEQEVTLRDQLQASWSHFVPLLDQAGSIVCRRLPPVAHALDSMFSFVANDLMKTASRATSGRFLDPTQKPKEMVSELNYMCLHVNVLQVKLEQLSMDSHNLQVEHEMDLSSSAAEVQRVKARKDLWELIAACTTWTEEWKDLLLSEVVVSEAQVKLAQWKEAELSLTGVIPTHDAVLQETSGTLGRLSRQMAVVEMLQSPSLKQRHWEDIFQGLGLQFVPQKKVTVSDLMPQHLDVHQELITKICREAQAERSMEQKLEKIQQGWRSRLFQLVRFTEHEQEEPRGGAASHQQPEGARLLITGLQELLAEVESDSMFLSSMLKSRHSADVRLQVDGFLQTLQDLGKLLPLFDRYQQEWVFLTKMFLQTSFRDQRLDLLERFQPVDETLKEMMLSISKEPHVLNLVHPQKTNFRFHGRRLVQILTDGVATMEAISNQMEDLMENLRDQFPRLWFLSDREVIRLLSSDPTLLTLQLFVSKCLRGIKEVDFEAPSTDREASRLVKVLGFFGSFQEHITFMCPLEANPNILDWLCVFEEQLKLTMVQLMKRCSAERNRLEPFCQDSKKAVLPVLNLLSEYPLQCMLVAEEVAWCDAVQQAFHQPSPVGLSELKACNSETVTTLSRSIRDGSRRAEGDCQYIRMCLRSLVQLTMKHGQQLSALMEVQEKPESSFQWLSLMKYRLNSEAPTCHVDVLNHHLQYGYEYCGPEDWPMVHTASTDRAALGMLLALNSYRGGLVSGPRMSGKKTTVVQLGRALGRQVVSLLCSPNTSLSVVQRMLLGAVQTGAWLLLDSVDLLTQGIQSELGQHLMDIHQSFSELTRNQEAEDRTDDRGAGCKHCVVVAGRNVPASPSYGCVLVSSGRFGAPEGLRWATRPVALTSPDYSVIAEVMLASIGFSEASALSRRLAVLLSLAEDSLCLPNFMSSRQSCLLVVLQKIISSSETQLQRTVSQRQASGERKLHCSYFPVIQGLMEETAIVKAILSVLFPALYEPKKASQFYVLLKNIFPVASQFPVSQRYLEEEEENQLKHAVTAAFHQRGFHSDSELISRALTLYQTMKSSQVVVLVGPAGSGKTACYRALAGALDHLAAGMVEDMMDGSELQSSAAAWRFVNTVVLFPNSMSHEEVLGFSCEDRGWQDGAVGKVLRDSETICSRTTQTWLVMDGNPAGRPGWFDSLATMCRPEDPQLCLSSGEALSSQHLKLLMEVTDLRDAGPSTVTRCSLVYFTGADLWKAVWRSEADALLTQQKLDRGTLNMWTRLAEDLFSSTLNLMKQKTLTSAVHQEGEAPHGVQEVMSFVRILHALLQRFGKEVEKVNRSDKTRTAGPDPQTGPDQLSRNLFLVAYIWGFGGHLHPRHWPQFDALTRQLLFNSRYKVVVPDEESVFDHFLTIDSRNALLTEPIPPKYLKYTHLLNLMVEAQQPVLLAGEPGSGKTTLCQTLLSFDRRHISLTGNTLLSSRDLHTFLAHMTLQKTQQRLLLFVDDLHEASCDFVFGKTSEALETLRQMISLGGILSFDGFQFHFLSSAAVSFMATCCPPGSLSSRLSGLFSIFVLPSLSVDVMFSILSPRLKVWLTETPQQRGENMICWIIDATKDLYEAVCEHFLPSKQRPHFVFSHRDLQKVLRGMCLWQPDLQNTGRLEKLPGFPPASVLNVAHLWMHECMRTFSDRLSSEDERQKLVSLIAQTAAAHFGLGDETQQDPEEALDPASGHVSTAPSLLSGYKPQLIQHMEDMSTKLLYGPELSVDWFRDGASYQQRDVDALLQELKSLIDRKQKEEGQEVATTLMVHSERVNQLLHVLRVLITPGGHGVLISLDSGTGRKTTVRLAALVTGCQLMEVHSGNEEQLHEVLREAGNRSRGDGGPVIVLVHEGISPSSREQVLVAMARRNYPGIHTDQELRDVVSRVTAERRSRRYLMDSWMFEKYLSQSYRNVHVFLLLPFIMTDSSDGAHGADAQLTKALSSSCCVEVYQPWSTASLVEAAAQCLRARAHQSLDREGSEASLSAAMAGIHQSACRYASVLLRAQPFSPQTFMEFIAHFGFLCSLLQEQQQSRADRVASVLCRLEDVNITAAQSKQNVMRLQERMDEMHQREEEQLRVVDCQRRLLEEALERCSVLEKELHHLEEQIRDAQKQVGPVLLAGLEILHCLNPSDLEEVRRYRDPPDGVVRVMDAICLLFNRPPGWESAKQLLGQSNFFQELEFFDRRSLTEEQVQQLGLILHSPQFEPESVLEVSRACWSLCRWVQAVYQCCCMQRHLLVKEQLETLDKDAQGRLHQAKLHREESHRRLEEAKLHLQLLRKQLEEEQLELQEAESSEREAAAAAEQLETHVSAWTAAAQEAELNHQTSAGDAVLLAAVISYLGPFGPDIRSELLNKWRKLVQTGSIDLNPEDPRTSLFSPSHATPPYPPLGFPIPVSKSLPLGRVLGTIQDGPPTREVVKLLLWGCRRSWVQRWPLLADTGEQVQLEKEMQCEMVICGEDPDLLDKLDQAAEKGFRVLVTDVERVTPSPQLLGRLDRSAGCFFPGLKQRVQLNHQDFCLFLSTSLPVRLLHTDIQASILGRLSVVDLSLSSDQVQEVMLSQLLQDQNQKVLIQHRRLQNDKLLLQERLLAEEDALMDYILQSSSSLLQDSAFLPRVTVCQEAMKNLQLEVKLLTEELQHHQALLASPRALTRLAAAFYGALQEASRLSPSYHFPLRRFISVIQEVFIVKGRLLAGRPAAEVMNRMAAQLLVQFRPSLFKNHVGVLELLLSVALLQHNQLCSEAERAAFLRGLQDLILPASLPPDVSPPSWIPPHIHPELLHLDQISAFRGLISSLSSWPAQWQEYLHLPSSTAAGGVPCCSHSHLSLLQRALLWKTLLPDCLERLAQDMAAYHLYLPTATGMETPHTGNPEALYWYVARHEGPVILTLPGQRGEEWTSVQPLYLINRMSCCVAAEKVQVKVVSCGALVDPELVLSALDVATNEGHWLVFNDCHLLQRWDGEVVDRLTSCLREELHHPSFRLWFISGEEASCSIPAVVRLGALPLVCDSPWDLKEELSSSLRLLASAVHRGVPPSMDDMELLLRCCSFHSVLLQRQSCRLRGRVCYWNQEDLLSLVDACLGLSGLCQDSAEALRYLAVNLVHGAHVMDSADLEVVDAVAQTCLSRTPPPWEAHFLSEITSAAGHCGWSDLLQMLEQHLKDSDISDVGALGFGADVAADIIKIRSHTLNTLLQRSQTPPGAARSSLNLTAMPSVACNNFADQ